MPSSPACVLTAQGPRAAEELLLDALEQDRAAVRADLALLARPLRVLVPSKSLRMALEERLAARGAFPGVAIQTLHRFAEELHERAGVPLPRGEALLPILVRRLAHEHAELAPLARERAGLLALVAALRDLQHAGFTAAHAAALEDCLAELAAHPATARARALVALAQRVERALLAAECAPAGASARSAGELVRAHPELCAARALWIHGFQDAPGTTSELLEALATRAGAHVVFDTLALALPTGPTGTRYGEALAARLGVALPAPSPALTQADVELEFVEALGPRAEARAAATAVQRTLAQGIAPERIAVVARVLPGVGSVLAGELRALGVPFSGLGGAGSPTAEARAAHALAEVLEDGARAHVVRALRAGWALPPDLGCTEQELLAACGLLGATRLETLAALDLPARLGGATALRLPGGRGRTRSERAPEEDEETQNDPPEVADELEPAEDRHRRVPARAVAEVRERARAWIAALAAAPAPAPFEKRAQALRTHVAAHFPALALVLDKALDALARECPAGFALAAGEFLELAAQALRAAVASPLGGQGAGVQLLDALEARSRTFDALFLADLRQGSFPRGVHEEPLLPDRLRARLRDVLPDLPLKSAALSEEETLFAGLVCSAPRVVLSWPRADEEGAPRSPSPFVRRAWRERRTEELAPGRARLASFAPERAGDPARVPLARTEHEELARLALAQTGALADGFAEVLAAAGRSGPLALRLARNRLAVLAELEPPANRPAYPNAFLGALGPRTHPRDARAKEPHVSGLEALASCPWQMLLERVLGLAPAVPVRDLGAVLEPAHVGTVVHETLAALTRQFGARWPDEARVRAACEEQAQLLVQKQHIVPTGLARLLALRALGFLDVARRLDAQAAESPRAEVAGELAVAGHTLHFRADRVAGPEWTDFKTSRRPLTEAKKAATRAEHVHEAVRTGKALQAPAYAFAAGPEAHARYVFLHPRIEDENRVQSVAASDAAVRAQFELALQRLWSAWDAGAFPPRLVDSTLRREHSGCEHCDFRAACQRGDSGMRTRTAAWVRNDAGAAPQAGFAGALQGLWRMKRPAPEPGA